MAPGSPVVCLTVSYAEPLQNCTETHMRAHTHTHMHTPGACLPGEIRTSFDCGLHQCQLAGLDPVLEAALREVHNTAVKAATPPWLCPLALDVPQSPAGLPFPGSAQK
jgi:hypothetical protein